MTSSPAQTKDEAKIYPEILYHGIRISESGSQPVHKRLLPDGEFEELPIQPSYKLSGHSPEFNWGYGGSAPTQLALALLLDATTVPETSLAYCAYFTQDIVSKWGRKWLISRSEILLWIAEEQKKQLVAEASRN